MALEKKELERKFKFGEVELTDPNRSLSVSQVQDFYANQYPGITNANVNGPVIENDKLVYSFDENVGKKG
jgi:PRTRC genetic system protein C